MLSVACAASEPSATSAALPTDRQLGRSGVSRYVFHRLSYNETYPFFPPNLPMDEQRIFLRPPLWVPILAVIIGGLFYVSGKKIEADNMPGEEGMITVSGEGRAFAVPDIAEISVGVSTGRQATAAAAMEKLKTDMDSVIAAAKEEGVEEKDIRTESFWLNPAYDWQDGRQIPRGFEASQSVRIKVRDIDNVSAVLGATTAGGANQAGSVNFTVDDPEEKRAEAREEAIEEAKAKAEVLADQLGVSLGEIKSFNEGFGGGVPPPIYYERMAVGMGGGSDAANQASPLPAGEQEMVVTVNITYELE